MKVVVRALVRWSWVLVICLLVGWFGGKELAKLLPPTYQAVAIVQLNAQAHTSQIIQPVAAYAFLVTSDSEVGQALKPYPQIDRTNFVAKQLLVTTDSAAQTISISVTLTSAKDASNLANTLAQMLVTQQNANITAQYNTSLQQVNQQIADEQKIIDQTNLKIQQTPPTSTTTIQQLQAQVSQHQNLQTQAITKRQQLQTEQALFSNPLAVIQAATPPTKPSSALASVPLAPVTLVVALLLGLVVISFIEQTAGRVNGVSSLQKTELPVLGTLRWTSPSPREVPLQKFCGEKAPYAEDCRIMMADILFHTEEAHAHIVAVAGTKARVGTSSIAAQLAALIAQSKRRVLLVDANLHEPAQHKRLNLSNDAGLARMLEEARNVRLATGLLPSIGQQPVEMGGQRGATIDALDTRKISSAIFAAPTQHLRSMGESVEGAQMQNGHGGQHGAEPPINFPFESYIHTTDIKNLFALPAGKSALNPSSLLSMPEMELFLRWACRSVDYIVLDCPSLVYAESHVLSSLSDQTYLVVDATKDRVKQVVNARKELADVGIKLAGLVVNKLGRWI